MKVYAIDLKPESDFATDLTGDCLFGQICWQLAQDSQLAGNIDSLLSEYDHEPFAVISDPVISFQKDKTKEFLFRRPFVPPIERPFAELTHEQQKSLFTDRKRRKGCRWVIVSDSQKLDPLNVDSPVNCADIIQRYGLADDWRPELTYTQYHNSIDRLTGTTGTDGAFAPFGQNLTAWSDDINLTVFAGLNEKISIDSLIKALERIGMTGYGADASTGKGRFSVGDCKEVDLRKFGSAKPDSVYTLSSSLPAAEIYREICFEPSVRFGRHGNTLANSDYPFKQPVLKAAAGAVFKPIKDYWPQKSYIGRAIRGLSKHAKTVEQGYSLYIPVKSEV